MVGDFAPSEIKEEHIVQLKDEMLKAGSSAATINKGRGILAAMFSNAKKNRKIATNPCADMEKLKVPEKEVESPYTIQELQLIFNSQVFTNGFKPKAFKGESSFWMPLLGLYTSARLNEIGQLYVDDVGCEDNIHYILIKPDEATDRTTKDMKKRRVPIHPDLIKMGFIDYVNKIRTEGHQQLFPELKVLGLMVS